MGGDHAPAEVIKGALGFAAHTPERPLLLVGQPDAIRREAPELPPNVQISAASEVITMRDKPVEALRYKKDNSISVAVNLVKAGEAGAMVSAGSTGATVAASLLGYRKLPGVDRPAIATIMPNKHGQFLLLDAGASPDVDPEHLVEFARMGRLYAELVMGKVEPCVHLLNIGEEDGKGNAFAKQTYKLLSHHAWFAGNCEGKDLANQPIDVVVCEAFVGNIVLKTAEGVAEFILGEIKKAALATWWTKLAALPMRSMLAPLQRRMDYAEYGGSPLLGLNHLTIVAHGRSNAKAIRNAIRAADTALEHDLIGRMRSRVAPIPSEQ